MKSKWKLSDCVGGIWSVLQAIFLLGLAAVAVYVWYNQGCPFLLSFYVGIICWVYGGITLFYHGAYVMIHGYYKKYDIR